MIIFLVGFSTLLFACRGMMYVFVYVLEFLECYFIFFIIFFFCFIVLIKLNAVFQGGS